MSNITSSSYQLLYTTVRISAKTMTGKKTGTGCIIALKYSKNPNMTIPFLLTNYHVVEGAVSGEIIMNGKTNNLPDPDNMIVITFSQSDIEKWKLDNLDVVAVPLGPALNDVINKGKDAFYISLSPDIIPPQNVINELQALEDIVFIGYPEGIYDQKNKTPIMRKGITATPIWNDFNGGPKFLIDASAFPGSSGSPVFIFNNGSYSTNKGITIGNRIYFLGILTETINSGSWGLINLGVVIKSWTILDKIISKYSNML